MKKAIHILSLIIVIITLGCKDDPFSVFADSESDFKIVTDKDYSFSYEGMIDDVNVDYTSSYAFLPTSYDGNNFERLLITVVILNESENSRFEINFQSYSTELKNGEYSILEAGIDHRLTGYDGFSSEMVIDQNDSNFNWLKSNSGKVKLKRRDDGSWYVMFDINYRSSVNDEQQNIRGKGKILITSDTECICS